MARLVLLLLLLLLLIGWKTGASLLSQSLSVAIAITELLSTVIWKLLYSVIDNYLLFGLTIDRTEKPWLFYGIHLLMKKAHPTNNIRKQRRSSKEREDLNIWILICEITRGMQHSVMPCIHEINECQQNRFNTFGNKFCKNFCHYIFLVQFVFGPHIPCYNVTTTTEKPTWNDLWMHPNRF